MPSDGGRVTQYRRGKESRRVLVTGGAGFIGSHLVQALVERGDAVRVLDNFSTGRSENLSGVNAEIVAGDIMNLDQVRRTVAGTTHVIHLAALVSVPGSMADPLHAHAVNATGTLHVLLAARDAGVKRVVFASSSAVYGEARPGAKREDMPLRPLSPYGVAKLAAENYCAMFSSAYGLETVVLRYFNVFGPRQNPRSQYAAVIPKFITAVLDQSQPTLYGDGEQTRDFTHVENVVHGNLLALEAVGVAGRVFNMATGSETSLNQLVKVLGEIGGRNLHPKYVGPRPGDIRHSSADISEAGRALGYQPLVDLRAGLQSTLDWYAGQRVMA